jgi:hypothetical protein
MNTKHFAILKPHYLKQSFSPQNAESRITSCTYDLENPTGFGTQTPFYESKIKRITNTNTSIREDLNHPAMCLFCECD